MRRAFKWLGRLALVLVIFIAGLFVPVAYNEFACIGEPVASDYSPQITDPDWQRAEARTLMTYPEWHIVHAYDDYAQVIETGDPHDYRYLNAIGGFWSSLCALSEASGQHGGVDGSTKQLVYTIGVSFTAELLFKAAYEETMGRIFAIIDGDGRAPLEDLSARQAADYAAFLQQVPWYKWNFVADREALSDAKTDRLRDRERNLALGLEYGAKARYAKVIASAVESVGADELQIRTLVKGLSETQFQAVDGVRVVSRDFDLIEIETPRYRTYTGILQELAARGADFVEIAGNDDIMFTVIAPGDASLDNLHSFSRQGYGDTRHLILTKVSDLAGALRGLGGNARLEHIHDY